MQVTDEQDLFTTNTGAELQSLPTDALEPHPNNPRVRFDQEVISQIAGDLKRQGFFSEEHALLCRPKDGGYQIISGHHRWKAAQEAGLDEVPCWVRPMEDDEAYMLLVTENSQSELSELEIGLHALETVGRGKRGRGNKGDGLKAYAERTEYEYQSIREWVKAAEVAVHCKNQERSWFLGQSIQSLYEISKAPDALWEPLVGALIDNEWSVRDTRHYRKKAEEFDIPERWESVFLNRDAVVSTYLGGEEFSPQTVSRLVDLADNTVQRINTYDVDAEEYLGDFRDWLGDNAGTPREGSWDARTITKYQRELQAKLEKAEEEARRSWALGNWRDNLDTLEDGSVRLVLTDPPYGIDYQSNRREDQHEKIANDQENAAGELYDSLRQLRPKLAEDAHLLVFTQWHVEADTQKVIEEAGYSINGSLVWVKNNHGMGDLESTFAPKHERIIHAVKGSPVLFDRQPDVLHADKVPADRHPTEKPISLLSDLIKCTTTEGELVADPFGGVASTLLAARDNDREAWGCEVNEKYHAAGADRLS